MTEQQHHHHHHRHKKDGATLFKERTLNSIVFRKRLEKVLKIVLIVLAVIMGLGVIAAYTIG